jgi:hypothetical protein
MKWMDPQGRQDPVLNYLDRAIDAIDSRLGEGYAKAHPELIGWVMQTLVMELVGDYEQVAEAIKDLGCAIRDAGDRSDLTRALKEIAEAIGCLDFERSEAAE